MPHPFSPNSTPSASAAGETPREGEDTAAAAPAAEVVKAASAIPPSQSQSHSRRHSRSASLSQQKQRERSDSRSSVVPLSPAVRTDTGPLSPGMASSASSPSYVYPVRSLLTGLRAPLSPPMPTPGWDPALLSLRSEGSSGSEARPRIGSADSAASMASMGSVTNAAMNDATPSREVVFNTSPSAPFSLHLLPNLDRKDSPSPPAPAPAPASPPPAADPQASGPSSNVGSSKSGSREGNGSNGSSGRTAGNGSSGSATASTINVSSLSNPSEHTITTATSAGSRSQSEPAPTEPCDDAATGSATGTGSGQSEQLSPQQLALIHGSATSSASSEHPENAFRSISPIAHDDGAWRAAIATFDRRNSQRSVIGSIAPRGVPPRGTVQTPGIFDPNLPLPPSESENELDSDERAARDAAASKATVDDSGDDEHWRSVRRSSESSFGDTLETPAVDRLMSFDDQGLKDASSSSSSDSALEGGDLDSKDSQVALRHDMTVSSSTKTPPLPMTTRFEYVPTADGHQVVTGHHRKVQRCEDEPIHIPGAVQGFGVLMAVEEDKDGCFVVRQVSENSTEILGLSPKFLFGLECLTDIFDRDEANKLRDNVYYLSEPGAPEDGHVYEEGPQIFSLSGRGERGSGIEDDVSDSEGSEDEETGERDTRPRKHWTCWCAAHRPRILPTADGSPSPHAEVSGTSASYPNGLTILEFELERDMRNPLYPPAPPRTSTMPGSGASSGSGTPGLTTARRSTRSDETMRPESDHDPTPQPGYARDVLALQQQQVLQSPVLAARAGAAAGEEDPDEIHWEPGAQEIMESTTSYSRPLRALERLRRTRRVEQEPRVGLQRVDEIDPKGIGAEDVIIDKNQSQRQVERKRKGAKRRNRRGGGGQGVGTLDIFAVLSQVNDQLGSADSIEEFLKIAVGVIKDLTQFHRVLIYQFDEAWNGQVVSELVDWSQTHDLYKGLHFPAGDIPAQARELYKINKVRLLYDRDLSTARMVCRSVDDLQHPLDMTHSYLRAMSPIHLKYLANMSVRASMSISIMAFGNLWGLVACHSYGGSMRVSFPVRQMLRLLSDSLSRNIERLSYARRLQSRKLISTLPTDAHPGGYIVSNAEDLLSLFDADFGVLAIGDASKILGPMDSGQEIMAIAEFLRLKQIPNMQFTQSIADDFPEMKIPGGLDIIAGLLFVPLSAGGRDFICFLRRGQLRQVNWAGRPTKNEVSLEPRSSFKSWSEMIRGKCRQWTDEQLETAGVLALVYGKFIEVWRQKETAMRTNQLTNILLSNASHEVRTPLNHIINYLELALDGHLDPDTRENLLRSRDASKTLLFTINDLLDLTKLESGQDFMFQEPLDLPATIRDAVESYKSEAWRRGITLTVDTESSPAHVVSDHRKIRTVVSNLTSNAIKYTKEGSVTVECKLAPENDAVQERQVTVEIVVEDTGIGIEPSKLETIFREFEQVESTTPHAAGLGLGLATVARIVEHLGGQLRCQSKPGKGSRFSFLIPFNIPRTSSRGSKSVGSKSVGSGSTGSLKQPRCRANSNGSSGSITSAAVSLRSSSGKSEIDSVIDALSSSHISQPTRRSSAIASSGQSGQRSPGQYPVRDSSVPLRSAKVDTDEIDAEMARQAQERRKSSADSIKSGVRASIPAGSGGGLQRKRSTPTAKVSPPLPESGPPLRVLYVDDDPINRSILKKRLGRDGVTVELANNGDEGAQKVDEDETGFDCIFMDIQMPVSGWESTKLIREREETKDLPSLPRRPTHEQLGRLPVFAVSASLTAADYDHMREVGMDGFFLKPIQFNVVNDLLKALTDKETRDKYRYLPGHDFERGGIFV